MKDTEISEIQIFPIRPHDGLVAFASCLFNGRLSLNSIAVYTKPDGSGYRLVYPAKKLPNGKIVNIFYPIDRETGEVIRRAVADKFEELAEKIKEEDNEKTKGFSDQN